MYKGYFIAFWVLLYLFRFLYQRRRGNSSILIVSFFLTTIPLQFNIPLGTPAFDVLTGTLGSQMYIYSSLLMFIVLFPLYNFRLIKIRSDPNERWIWFILFFLVVSVLNYNNTHTYGTLVAAVFFISNILFFYFLRSNISRESLLKGIYDGFMVLGFANFLLAICFPILNMTFVTTMIHVAGEEGATRMDSESRAGAIGFFSHPGNLALYSTVSSVFFLYFIRARRMVRTSYFILFINFATLVLTFSRTAFLVYAINMAIAYYILKYPGRRIFSPRNMVRFGIPLAIILIGFFVYAPPDQVMNQSDLSDQFDNRAMHWLMGFLAFQNSPIIGVGLNSHLLYLSEHLSIINNLDFTDFFLQNPIHNIHLIILSELGLAGLVCWIYFLVSNMNKSKRDIDSGNNVLLSITHIGFIVSFILYGITGWAPFSMSILPYFLFITYFANVYRGR